MEPKVKKELKTLLNLFYETVIPLIPKPDKDKRKLHNIPMSIGSRALNKIQAN